MIVAKAAIGDWELHHVDVEHAFIQAQVENEMYFKLPPNYQEFEGAVKKLNRSLYGIVQASHKWNSVLTKELKNIGYEQ